MFFGLYFGDVVCGEIDEGDVVIEYLYWGDDVVVEDDVEDDDENWLELSEDFEGERIDVFDDVEGIKVDDEV